MSQIVNHDGFMFEFFHGYMFWFFFDKNFHMNTGDFISFINIDSNSEWIIFFILKIFEIHTSMCHFIRDLFIARWSYRKFPKDNIWKN